VWTCWNLLNATSTVRGVAANVVGTAATSVAMTVAASVAATVAASVVTTAAASAATTAAGSVVGTAGNNVASAAGSVVGTAGASAATTAAVSAARSVVGTAGAGAATTAAVSAAGISANGGWSASRITRVSRIIRTTANKSCSSDMWRVTDPKPHFIQLLSSIRYTGFIMLKLLAYIQRLVNHLHCRPNLRNCIFPFWLWAPAAFIPSLDDPNIMNNPTKYVSVV